MARPPVSEQVQVNFRMPADLRDRIKRHADAEGASMSAAIVDALQRTFPAPRDVQDVVDDVIAVLLQVQPELRERAISALQKRAENGSLSIEAEACAHIEKDMSHRFLREND